MNGNCHKDKRTWISSVMKDGDDHACCNYIKNGTKEEVIEFWNSEAGRDEIYESLRDMFEEQFNNICE